MNNTLVIVIGCCWGKEPDSNFDGNALCGVTIQRLKKIVSNLQEDNLLAVTGNVPYSKRKPDATLTNCMQKYLWDANIKQQIHTINGLNPFEVSRNGIELAVLLEATDVVIVSSDFYFKLYERLWRAWAIRSNLKIEIVPIQSGHEASKEVWRFHSNKFGKESLLTIFASLNIFFGNIAESIANKKNIAAGFKLSGCKETP